MAGRPWGPCSVLQPLRGTAAREPSHLATQVNSAGCPTSHEKGVEITYRALVVFARQHARRVTGRELAGPRGRTPPPGHATLESRYR